MLALSQQNTPSADKSVEREAEDPLVACESQILDLGGYAEREIGGRGEAGRLMSAYRDPLLLL